MNKYCNEKLLQLDENLSEISSELNDSIAISEIAIRIILDTLSDLKQFILQKNFSNEDEEIQFFKELKPRIVAKLIYYNAIFKIETKKPYGGQKKVKKHLNNELNKLKRFFDNNLDFYKYYRTNSTYLDHKYFVRGRYDIKLTLDTFYFCKTSAKSGQFRDII